MLSSAISSATFGGGCFWAIEFAYQSIPGVLKTSVGYMGGHFENPCHLDVGARITGHAEVVQVEYDPTIVPYTALLEKFWSIHDPTTLNRQGPDRGEQYRSVIFYHTPEQMQAAIQSKRQLDMAGKFTSPIVTEIKPAIAYWLANEDHQQYLVKKREKSAPLIP